MPLTQTKDLAFFYENPIQLKYVTEEEFIRILSINFGASQKTYDRYQMVSDANHDQDQAILDFVQTSGHKITPERLHDVIKKLINSYACEHYFKGPNLTLGKAFLAFEMIHYPQQANLHFESPNFQKLYPNAVAINKFKKDNLSSIIKELRILNNYPDKSQAMGEYLLVTHDLTRLLETKDAILRSAGMKLIELIRECQAPYSFPISQLTDVLSHTLNLVAGDISIVGYRNFAKDAPYQLILPPSRGKKAFAMAAMASASASVVLSGPLTALAIMTIGGHLVSGVETRTTGLTKLMNEFADIVAASVKNEAAASSIDIPLEEDIEAEYITLFNSNSNPLFFNSAAAAANSELPTHDKLTEQGLSGG